MKFHFLLQIRHSNHGRACQTLAVARPPCAGHRPENPLFLVDLIRLEHPKMRRCGDESVGPSVAFEVG